MGIVNCTPDSFYTGQGVLPTVEELERQISEQLAAGATIIDLGGCSTRPGSLPPTVEEEWQRVQVGLQAVRRVLRRGEHRPILSIDTFRSEVARRAIHCYDEVEVGMINDVTGGIGDAEMYRLVAASGVRYVAMHMRGTPQTMQQQSNYDDVVAEVIAALKGLVEAMRSASIADRQIILDVGFGFAKQPADGYRLVARLPEVAALGFPLLVGVSRKSMIGHAVGASAADCLAATTALHWELLRQGASILRVHDVAAARQVIDLYNYYTQTIYEQ